MHSSKAIGEPPFFLGSSAFFAIKDAICAARKENNKSSEYYTLDLPATSERIRMACGDSIATSLCQQPQLPQPPSSEQKDNQYYPKGSW